VLVTARPNATPLATSPTAGRGKNQRRAHTRRPRLHHTGGFVCGQGPIIKRFCRARAAGEARPVRVARPLPARAARTRCAAYTPARVPRRTHPPAPRARTGPPAPARTRPRRPGVPLARPRELFQLDG
jgi:hypothetical protein